MRIVIFGLTVSSAWGNGHATLWRNLIRALDVAGHRIEFYEKDVPYYRAHRDLHSLPGNGRLRLYTSFDHIRVEAEAAASAADAAIVTSYCPDGRAACELVLGSRARTKVFYDLDTPITLARLQAGDDVPYIPTTGLTGFDLVLSFTGGRALDLLRERLGARVVAALYGSVDPTQHRPVMPDPTWSGACSYLGTWSDDRQAALEALFVEAARLHPSKLFVIGGSKYPEHVKWPTNIVRFEHVPPPVHSAFYCSSPITLSVTRAPMADLGFCPSGRLFEAAACGVPVLTDVWQGVDTFFAPGEEILLAHTTDDVVAALSRPTAELVQIGKRARTRALAEHSGKQRAGELVELLQGVRS
jgi:spore maturation protein CgeB